MVGRGGGHHHGIPLPRLNVEEEMGEEWKGGLELEAAATTPIGSTFGFVAGGGDGGTTSPLTR